MIQSVVKVFLKNKFFRYVLVFIQFFVLAWLTFTYDFAEFKIWHWVLPIIFLIFGFWSLLFMKISTITPLPDPTSGSQLIQKGPYRYVRHPMYLSVAGYCFCLLMVNFSLLNALIVGLFYMAIFLKMEIEEVYLVKHYASYKEYMKRTKRLIPFVY
ncbi:MAG: isoprenylcysteine carboxylmethyltransferase family protein [Bacteroidales bacterium]|nr:isoprenylcysteine carboxylmethyltransferase family protein [Bacteroidales bacterium]MDY0217043.1 isoprenylcysteine carboxylmethyltransferase family protein [Bacteroidales bacterium]